MPEILNGGGEFVLGPQEGKSLGSFLGGGNFTQSEFTMTPGNSEYFHLNRCSWPQEKQLKVGLGRGGRSSSRLANQCQCPPTLHLL